MTYFRFDWSEYSRPLWIQFLGKGKGIIHQNWYVPNQNFCMYASQIVSFGRNFVASFFQASGIRIVRKIKRLTKGMFASWERQKDEGKIYLHQKFLWKKANVHISLVMITDVLAFSCSHDGHHFLWIKRDTRL